MVDVPVCLAWALVIVMMDPMVVTCAFLQVVCESLRRQAYLTAAHLQAEGRVGHFPPPDKAMKKTGMYNREVFFI